MFRRTGIWVGELKQILTHLNKRDETLLFSTSRSNRVNKWIEFLPIELRKEMNRDIGGTGRDQLLCLLTLIIYIGIESSFSDSRDSSYPGLPLAE